MEAGPFVVLTVMNEFPFTNRGPTNIFQCMLGRNSTKKICPVCFQRQFHRRIAIHISGAVQVVIDVPVGVELT